MNRSLCKDLKACRNKRNTNNEEDAHDTCAKSIAKATTIYDNNKKEAKAIKAAHNLSTSISFARNESFKQKIDKQLS